MAIPQAMAEQLAALIGQKVRITKPVSGCNPEDGSSVPLQGVQGTVLWIEPDGHCAVRIDEGPCAGLHIGLRPTWTQGAGDNHRLATQSETGEFEILEQEKSDGAKASSG